MDWKRFFDSLGMDGTKWQWRIIRWERRWQHWFAVADQKRGTVTYKHKFCNACGALMDRDEKVCPHCGRKAPSWRAQVVKRIGGLVLPRWHPVSGVLLAANLVNMVVAMILFGVGQIFAPSSQILVAMGALVPPWVLAGEWWRVITYGYLHIGFIHIAMNMVVLSQVGPELEKEIRSARFFVVYTLSLVGAAAADLIVRGNVLITIAGASGALFGLIGFGASYSHFYGGALGRDQRNFYLHWAVYAFLFGLFLGFDNWAHAGGFVTGAILGFVVERERLLKDRLTPVWTVLAYLCLLVTVAAFVWLILAGRGIV